MKQGEMDKVVLARVCEMRFPETVAVDAALTHLTARYPGCMTFLFEPRPQHAFFVLPRSYWPVCRGTG